MEGSPPSITVQRLECDVWATEGRSKGQRRRWAGVFLPQGPATEHPLRTVPAAERFLKPGTAHHHNLEHAVTGSLTPLREKIHCPQSTAKETEARGLNKWFEVTLQEWALSTSAYSSVTGSPEVAPNMPLTFDLNLPHSPHPTRW